MSLTSLIHHNLDWAAFSALVVCVFLVARYLLRRLGSDRRLGPIPAITVVCACGVAFFVTDWVSERERQRAQVSVSSLAPTYARELEALGHHQLADTAKPEDPLYRTLLNTQQRWLALNPRIARIFTFRVQSNGDIVYAVDATSDRNLDGRLEGDHEISHPMGTIFEGSALDMLRAHCGVSVFQERAFADAWGTWIRAFEPLRDDTGRIEAGLVVEFDAREWIEGEAAMRLGLLTTLFVALLIYLAATTTTLILRSEIDRRRDIEAELRRGEQRLRTILDHDPDFIGLVGPDGNLLEVNPAGVRMIGAPAKEQVLGRSLEAVLLPVQPDRLRSLYRSGQDATSSSVEYQIKGVLDKPRWVHSHSVPLGPRFGFTRTFLIVTRDIHEQKIAQEEAARLHRELVDASRVAGMAEIATGVLHNVGNVINTANIACSTASSQLDELCVESVRRLAQVLTDHESDLPAFFANDPRARTVPPLLGEIASALEGQQLDLRSELETLARALDHVKSVIHSQQSLARTSTVYELVDPREIAEEALRMNSESLDRHGIHIERKFAQCPALALDRHKILQVLVNLITNAKEAVLHCPPERRVIRIELTAGPANGRTQVTFEVLDRGVGISAEHLPKIFTHGFSTRPGGHGFGLHSSVLAAREMGGDLTVHSDGPNQGASFKLRVPARTRAEMVNA